MKKLHMIILGLVFALGANAQQTCEKLELEPGTYIQDGNLDYACALSVYYGEGKSLIFEFINSPKKSSVFCKTRNMFWETRPLPGVCNTYTDEDSDGDFSHFRFRALDSSSFTLQVRRNDFFTYEKYVF